MTYFERTINNALLGWKLWPLVGEVSAEEEAAEVVGVSSLGLVTTEGREEEEGPPGAMAAIEGVEEVTMVDMEVAIGVEDGKLWCLVPVVCVCGWNVVISIVSLDEWRGEEEDSVLYCRYCLFCISPHVSLRDWITWKRPNVPLMLFSFLCKWSSTIF